MKEMEWRKKMKEEEKKICQCEIPLNLQEDQMYEKIAAYLSRLDPEECVADIIYEERLKACSSCADLIGGLTCKYCGCFVLARAKKKGQICPKPGKRNWE